MSEGVVGSLRASLSVDSARAPVGQARDFSGVARHFLFISAPFGPFARELARFLEKQGATCTRVVVNAGDAIDWGFKNAAAYFGDERGWCDWLQGLIERTGVTDLVTYGDSSPYSVKALMLGQSLNLRLYVFEQGYFRPDWVTLERGGVNANSRLPRDPDWYHRNAARLEPKEAARVGRTTPAMVARIISYHAAMYAGLPFFSRFRAPYHYSAIRQAIGHCQRYAEQRLSSAKRRQMQQALIESKRPLYLVLLQRPGDSQLWRHSDFECTEAFLEKVVTSFAAHAPEEAMLLVRPHPLDHGLDDHKSVLARLAAAAGIDGRVHFVDHGKLHEILPLMSGAVCVNSTAGLAAVEFGRPTVVLGRALYDMPGLTHQDGIDSFWRSPQAPDAGLYDAFRQVMMATTQINGAYATRRGRALAVPEAAARLLHDDRNEALNPSV
jgi:capsular polysaccharide export protein